MWGLPDEFHSDIEFVLKDELMAVRITGAAHAEIGSSRQIFAALTRLLCRVLAGGLPEADHDVWKLFDNCWSQ
jgi:hypothetical protein